MQQPWQDRIDKRNSELHNGYATYADRKNAALNGKLARAQLQSDDIVGADHIDDRAYQLQYYASLPMPDTSFLHSAMQARANAFGFAEITPEMHALDVAPDNSKLPFVVTNSLAPWVGMQYEQVSSDGYVQKQIIPITDELLKKMVETKTSSNFFTWADALDPTKTFKPGSNDVYALYYSWYMYQIDPHGGEVLVQFARDVLKKYKPVRSDFRSTLPPKQDLPISVEPPPTVLRPPVVHGDPAKLEPPQQRAPVDMKPGRKNNHKGQPPTLDPIRESPVYGSGPVIGGGDKPQPPISAPSITTMVIIGAGVIIAAYILLAK